MKQNDIYLVLLSNLLIFFSALSQDENEMGRFLKDQGSLDKTKAGKMMIAVGKAQSFAAQQRFHFLPKLFQLINFFTMFIIQYKVP